MRDERGKKLMKNIPGKCDLVYPAEKLKPKAPLKIVSWSSDHAKPKKNSRIVEKIFFSKIKKFNKCFLNTLKYFEIVLPWILHE